MGSEARRREATLAESRAVAHPLRLRIIRLCKDEALTNKEIAARLALSPGTTLHHVRTLVATGFLVEDGRRPGRRGTTEKPYRSTHKSWRLDVAGSSARASIEQAMLGAVAAELHETGPDGVIEATRASMRLGPAALAELAERLRALIDEYANRDDPDGRPQGMLIVLHRRGAAADPGAATGAARDGA